MSNVNVSRSVLGKSRQVTLGDGLGSWPRALLRPPAPEPRPSLRLREARGFAPHAGRITRGSVARDCCLPCTENLCSRLTEHLLTILTFSEASNVTLISYLMATNINLAFLHLNQVIPVIVPLTTGHTSPLAKRHVIHFLLLFNNEVSPAIVTYLSINADHT